MIRPSLRILARSSTFFGHRDPAVSGHRCFRLKAVEPHSLVLSAAGGRRWVTSFFQNKCVLRPALLSADVKDLPLPSGVLSARPEPQFTLVTVHPTNRNKIFHCKMFFVCNEKKKKTGVSQQ